MSPHPVLLPSIQQEAQAVGVDAPGIASLMRDTSRAGTAMLASLARLHVAGHRSVDWPLSQHGVLVDLPSYPWQREHHWFEPGAASAAQSAVEGLLGAFITSSVDADARYAQVELGLDRYPWLADHAVRGGVIVPAAAFVEFACEAARRVLRADACAVQELRLEEALLLGAGQRRIVQVALGAGPPGRGALRIASRATGEGDAAWTLHASGLLRADETPAAGGEAQRFPEASGGTAATHYAAMRVRGLEYGPAFQGVVATVAEGGATWARIELPAGLSARGFVWHPALLDAALQAGVAAVADGDARETLVPVSFEAVRTATAAAFRAGARAVLRAATEPGFATVDLGIYSDDGRMAGEVRGMRLQRLGGARDAAAAGFHCIEWQPQASTGDAGRGVARRMAGGQRRCDRGAGARRFVAPARRHGRVARRRCAGDAGARGGGGSRPVRRGLARRSRRCRRGGNRIAAARGVAPLGPGAGPGAGARLPRRRSAARRSSWSRAAHKRSPRARRRPSRRRRCGA